MTKPIEQQMSELIDDELDATERERLFKGFKKQPRLVEQWERFHLISDALRHNLPDNVGHGLADRVRAAIDVEPTLLVPSKYAEEPAPVVGQPAEAGRRRWFVPAAAAASVAFAALVGVQLNKEFTDTGNSGVPVAATQPADSAGQQLATSAEQPVPLAQPEQSVPPYAPEASPVPQQQGEWLRAGVTGKPQINNYLVDHSEFSMSTGVQGIFPYARVVSHEVAGNK